MAFVKTWYQLQLWQCLLAEHDVLCGAMNCIFLCYLVLPKLLFIFAYTFPFCPYKYCENMYLVNEYLADNLTVVSLTCVLLLFFYTAKDHWGKLDLCRARADQTTPCCQRCPQQHRVRTDPLRGEPAVVTPLLWLSPELPHIYERKVLFLYFHLCLQCGGEPRPMAFKTVHTLQERGGTAFGHVSSDKRSLTWSWGAGTLFLRASAEPTLITFFSSPES